MHTKTHRDSLLTKLCTRLPLSDDGSHGEDSVLVGGIGPGGGRNGNEVMAEVDESINVLPLIEVVVTFITA